MFRITAMTLALLAAPFATTAQTVTDCARSNISPLSILEPWEIYSRSYANGDVRVAIIDLIEPAAVSLQLLVMFPPYDELGARSSCALIGMNGYGFGDIDFAQIQSSYDPARGLTLRVPVYIEGSRSILSTTINQATGTAQAALTK